MDSYVNLRALLKRALLVHAYILGVLILALIYVTSTPAHGHDWYEPECCNKMDCAPLVGEALPHVLNGVEGHLMRTEKGTTFVPKAAKRRMSKDAETHVCMMVAQFDEFGTTRAPDELKPFMCIYEPFLG